MLSNRKRVILVKLESTYGQDASPAAADAVLCSNLEITPLEGSSIKREFVRPYFGGSGSIRVENFVSLSFDTEIAGSGEAATPPQWGTLLKAANFSETITAAAITGTAQIGGSTTSIKLASGASAVDDFYVGMTISITDGTGKDQVGEIIDYDGATKIATLATAWTVAPDATSEYSIGANVIYIPNSDFGTDAPDTSVSIYFNVDGVRHVLLGARGNPAFDESAKSIAKIKWKFIGLLGTISDSALPAADFTGWQDPVAVSTENTTDINILGFNNAVLAKFDFDMGNQVVYRQLVGAESVLITDRDPKGNVSIEATKIADKDWWTMAKNAQTGPLCIKHGQTPGNIVGITAQKALITDPKYSELDGVTMLDFGIEFIPVGAAGNDELRICCK